MSIFVELCQTHSPHWLPAGQSTGFSAIVCLHAPTAGEKWPWPTSHCNTCSQVTLRARWNSFKKYLVLIMRRSICHDMLCNLTFYHIPSCCTTPTSGSCNHRQTVANHAVTMVTAIEAISTAWTKLWCVDFRRACRICFGYGLSHLGLKLLARKQNGEDPFLQFHYQVLLDGGTPKRISNDCFGYSKDV